MTPVGKEAGDDGSSQEKGERGFWGAEPALPSTCASVSLRVGNNPSYFDEVVSVSELVKC